MFNSTGTQSVHPLVERMLRLQVFGRSPVGFYLRLNRWLWRLLPARARNCSAIRAYGAGLHALVCLRSKREQYFGTYFMRNRPALELMARLAQSKAPGSALSVAVLASSIGAEVYSILWTIRSKGPDLKIILTAMDISKEILEFAQQGVYSPSTADMVYSAIFERLSEAEKRAMFDWDGDVAKIKPRLREGIIWKAGSAAEPALVDAVGPQDIVVASNFLCHMAPPDAESCLRNIANVVKPGGHLFVSGVDLEVRTKVAIDLHWKPVPDLMTEIHDGDPSVRADWPWKWWGLEPLNPRHPDWPIRYTAVFELP